MYRVVAVKTYSLFRGQITPKRLEEEINKATQDGWTLDRTIVLEARWLFFFKREVVFLILKKS